MMDTVQDVAYVGWVILQAVGALVLLVLSLGFFGWMFTGREIDVLPEGGISEATHVYYFYDEQGNLLYVGITNNLRRRWAQHAEDKPWWHLVARKESVLYSTRGEAEKVEAHQIRTHRPMFNRALNGWLR